MATEFMNPYSTAKLLSGVVPANKVNRPNWLQTFFGQTRTSEEKTVNFDVEFFTKNVMGMYVSPDVDTTPIMLPDYGHKELSFSYAKEGLNSPDYEEINTRALGQPIGKVDIAANEVLNIRAKLALAEQRFENLFELNASNLIFTGTHVAQSEKHPKVLYDFGRTKVTKAAEFNSGYVPQTDLTTLNVGGVGARAWSAGTGTPVKDLITMVNTCNRRNQVSAVVMSDNAYDAFEKDVTTNYKDAANLTLSVMNRVELKVLPVVEKFESLNFRRSFPVGQGQYVDIFTYDAIYHDRQTGAATKYVPDGYVAVLPSPDVGIKVYGRIMHPRANYAAMPRWVNFWENAKTGKREWEIHTSFLMGFIDINSVVAWKVM